VPARVSAGLWPGDFFSQKFSARNFQADIFGDRAAAVIDAGRNPLAGEARHSRRQILRLSVDAAGDESGQQQNGQSQPGQIAQRHGETPWHQ